MKPLLLVWLSLWIAMTSFAQTTSPAAPLPRDLPAIAPKFNTNFAAPTNLSAAAAADQTTTKPALPAVPSVPTATRAPDATVKSTITNTATPERFVPIPPSPAVPGSTSSIPALPTTTAPSTLSTNATTSATNAASLSVPMPAMPAIPALPGAPGPSRLTSMAALSNLLNKTSAPRTLPGMPGMPANSGARPGGTTVSPTPGGGTTNTLAKLGDDEIISAGMIKFVDADLNQVLDMYAEFTGRTVLRPATLPAAKISLRNQTPLTKAEGARALEAVFALNQISVVAVEDKFVKIVPEAQANRAAGEPVDKDKIARFGPLTTHIMQLKHADPKELLTAIQPFSSMQNSIVVVPSSQTLILRDYAENVRRMMEVIEKVDVIIPPNIEPVVIPIKYALATDIQQVLSGLSAGGSSMSIGGGSGGGGRSGRLSGGGATMGSGSSFGSGSMGGMGGMPGQQGGYGSGMNTGLNQMGGVNSGTTGAAGAARSAFANRLSGIIKQGTQAAGGGQFQLLGAANIIADERANSLLIFAEKEDMTIITNIIAKLDVVLAQVLIETLIFEVSLSDSLEYGVSAQQVKASDVAGVMTGMGALNPKKLLGFTSFSGGTNGASQLNDGLTYVARFGQDLDVTARAVASDSRANLISRPRILTSHAKEGSIFIGETRPYITGSYGGGGYGGYGGYGGGYGGYSQYQQLQIGIQLSILPFINSEGLVVMDIKQRIQGFAGSVTIDGNEVPKTTDKEATAYIAVRDRDTVILGGYINADTSTSHSGVPILKDIPILGALFRSNSRTADRKEMLVLVRPTVINTPEAAASISSLERDKLPSISAAEREYEEENRKEKVRLDSIEKKKNAKKKIADEKNQ